MLTLCIDTAYKYLTVALIKDNELLSFYSEEANKSQSEKVFGAIDEVFKKANIDRLSIDSVCISEGPGSYTGTRIAMTVAKVLCKVQNIDLYTISTLRLYANNKENTMAIMDARANRVYCGVFNNDEIIEDDHIEFLDKLNVKEYKLVGDLNLINKEDVKPNIPECFLNTKSYWHKVDNIDYVVPKYLKESDSYYR